MPNKFLSERKFTHKSVRTQNNKDVNVNNTSVLKAKVWTKDSMLKVETETKENFVVR